MKLIQRFMTRVLPATLLALAVVPSSAAQQAPSQDQTSTSGAVRLNKAPVSQDILQVHMSGPVRMTLDNGLRVLIVEDHRSPMIYMTATIKGAGPVYDPASQPGLAEFTAAILREGTASRNSKQITREMTRLGVTFGGGATGTRASLAAIGLRENFAQWRAILLDMLLHPSFPESEIELRKEQTFVRLKQDRTDASFLADERMQKALYGDHPAAIVSPTEASVRAMTQ